MVEFETLEQAETAKDNLNGIPFFGRSIAVNFSKHQTILPSTTTAGTGTGVQNEVDYSMSKEHRFKIEGSKNFSNIAVSIQIF